MADPQSDGIKSPIIMRVDEPTDEEITNENSDEEVEDLEITSSQICSPTVTKPLIATSKFGNPNPFNSNNATLNTLKSGSKSLLKPSKLGTNSSLAPVKNSFTLNPSRLNPFSKLQLEDNSNNCESVKSNINISATNGETPKFVPLLLSESKKSDNIVKSVTNVLPAKTQANQSNFVFGQNLQERVIADSADDPKPSTSCLNTNGTSEMLFSSAIKDTVRAENPDGASREAKSLSESAREYEESRANKRKYEEVEVITGEEEETNVLHVSCKLFAYDKALGAWQERGRGNIRLNDQEVDDNSVTYRQSRLVFRTSGSLRVILNTKIWADMSIQQASAKSVRFTAIDNSGEIKVFLVMASPEDVAKLYRHLEERVRNEVERQRHKKINIDSTDHTNETN